MIAALIMGRKGSTGLPGKNTMPVLGRPLAEYCILAARHAACVDRVYVTTDDERLMELGEKHGARVIERPAELCTKEALGEDVYRHAYSVVREEFGQEAEQVALLMCNAATVLASQIDEAADILRAHPDYDSVVTASSYNMWSPLRARRENGEGLLDPFVPFETFDDPATLNCDRDSQGDVWFADMGLSMVRPYYLENMEEGLLPQKWMGRRIFPPQAMGRLRHRLRLAGSGRGVLAARTRLHGTADALPTRKLTMPNIAKKAIARIFDALGYEIASKKSRGPGSRPDFWPAANALDLTTYQSDSGFHALYETAQDHTQMRPSDNALRRLRHYALTQLAKQADLASGDVCECGCFRGLSTFQVASIIRERGASVQFHVFDSFQGLSELEDVDIPTDREQDLDQLRAMLACPLEQVQANMASFSFLRFYKGWIPERFPEVADRRFSFVHIDTDLYQPIWDSMEFFYPRLADHGIIVLDDYGCTQFPGAKKSVDDYLRAHGGKGDLFFSLPSGSAFLVKNALGTNS